MGLEPSIASTSRRIISEGACYSASAPYALVFLGIGPLANAKDSLIKTMDGSVRRVSHRSTLVLIGYVLYLLECPELLG